MYEMYFPNIAVFATLFPGPQTFNCFSASAVVPFSDTLLLWVLLRQYCKWCSHISTIFAGRRQFSIISLSSGEITSIFKTFAILTLRKKGPVFWFVTMHFYSHLIDYEFFYSLFWFISCVIVNSLKTVKKLPLNTRSKCWTTYRNIKKLIVNKEMHVQGCNLCHNQKVNINWINLNVNLFFHFCWQLNTHRSLKSSL